MFERVLDTVKHVARKQAKYMLPVNKLNIND